MWCRASIEVKLKRMTANSFQAGGQTAPSDVPPDVPPDAPPDVPPDVTGARWTGDIGGLSLAGKRDWKTCGMGGLGVYPHVINKVGSRRQSYELLIR